MSRCIHVYSFVARNHGGIPFSGVCPIINPIGTQFCNALHGRLAGRFKPPLAGRCNDFAPSRQKNCHRKKQPSRPGPRKRTKNTAPSRPVEKKKKPPRPASEKKTTAPSRLGKKKPRLIPPRKKYKTPRPASKKKQTRPVRHEQQNTPPRGWKLETNTTACLFLSFLLHIYIVL